MKFPCINGAEMELIATDKFSVTAINDESNVNENKDDKPPIEIVCKKDDLIAMVKEITAEMCQIQIKLKDNHYIIDNIQCFKDPKNITTEKTACKEEPVSSPEEPVVTPKRRKRNRMI